MFALAAVTIFIIIRSNRRFRNKTAEEDGDTMFQTIISTREQEKVWPLLLMYISARQEEFMTYAEESYRGITLAFRDDSVKALDKADRSLSKKKTELKGIRRKETLCFSHLSRETALDKSAWFYLSNNCCMSILYNLKRINEICKEHVENNFHPLPKEYAADFDVIRTKVSILFNDTIAMMTKRELEAVSLLRRHADETKDLLSDTYHKLHEVLNEGNPSTMSVLYVYLNLLQETQEMVSGIRKYLRAYAKLVDSDFSTRRGRSAVFTPV